MDGGGGSRKKRGRPSTGTPEKPKSKRPAGSSVNSPAIARPVRRSISSSFSGKPSGKSPSQRAAQSLLKIAKKASPLKFKSPVKRRRPWNTAEETALVQFVALHQEYLPNMKSWPSFGSKHAYWEEAAKYVNQSVKSPSRFRSAAAIRQHILTDVKHKFKTVDEAEDALGLSLEAYLEDTVMTDETSPSPPHLTINQTLLEKLMHLTPGQLKDIIVESLKLLSKLHTPPTALFEEVANTFLQLDWIKGQIEELFETWFKAADLLESITIVNKCFDVSARKMGIITNVINFPELSLRAMKTLQDLEKSNTVYNLSKIIGETRPDGSGSLIPLKRMPFGMIQFIIDFFACTNIMQVSVPDDYKLWHETMQTEFPTRFQRLFAGPMWSGANKEDIRNPLKARTNVPCRSLTTQWRQDKKSLFSRSTEVQEAALDALKTAHPSGRFWLKLDGTDVKVCLMESVKGVWNGDVDLGDGQLNQLRKEYDTRQQVFKDLSKSVSRSVLEESLQKRIDEFQLDEDFLLEGLGAAVTDYRKKFNNSSTSEESLKNANWEVVEFQTLVQQARSIIDTLEAILATLNPNTCTNRIFQRARTTLKDLGVAQYLRDLFKKKRTPASHVLVFMLSDEKRSQKPYALPVRYIPYRTLRDQFIRDFNKDIKIKMKEKGLKLVGTVSDGEFCSLTTQGETRALHVWQLVHDAKESVRKMSKQTLLQMLVMTHLAADGTPVTSSYNPAVPPNVIVQLHNLRYTDGMTLEDAVTFIRKSLVPDGYEPYPFKRDTPETMLDKLRSIMATFVYRHSIQELLQQGVDFTQHLYVPEIDPHTGEERHDRGDHNHIFKRIAQHMRNGGYVNLNYEAFDDVLKDPNSGLTHAALIGKRKQSVKDAERLLSYHVVASLQRQGYPREAAFVQVLANWHEASDGRGLSQLTRSRYNYKMLNLILDEWMPWHGSNYDFSTIDINRPVENILGFSRETVIEVTTNIESQEQRRLKNDVIGYPEHPRAAVTDDLEAFYAITHRDLGNVFVLKQFKEYWPKGVREFTKRMDNELPFYYWTLNERYTEEELPSFDECPVTDDEQELRNHPLRLHRLRINQREDSYIFVAGRAHLPASHKKTIRQSFHKPEDILPDPL